MAYPQNLPINETNIKTILLDLVYPVDSIFLSFKNTNPKTYLGGDWIQLKDRFLIGAGGDYAVNATGGEVTHTLTVDEMPAHTHTFKKRTWTSSGNCWREGVNAAETETGTTSSTGGGAAHNNMPPYLAVYMWKRTA